MMNPQTTVLVIKRDGREIGRVAATAKNAMAYVESHTPCEVEYVEDAAFCEAAKMLGLMR